MTEIEKIDAFLKANGWEPVETGSDEFKSFGRDSCVGIDVGEDEIVFIDDTGDYDRIPTSFYGLVGYVYVNRLILPVIPEFRS